MSTLDDCRYAIRTLRRAARFTIVAILTLALGIAINTTMFSVADAVMLRSLPYANPDRLAMLWTSDPTRGIEEEGTSYPTFVDWRSQSTTLADLAICSRGNPVTLTGAAEPEQVMGEAVSANLFSVLGVMPALGRSFSPEEEQHREPVVVLSHALWQRSFGGASDVLSRMLEIDGQGFQVIGVMPSGFYFPTKEVQLWQPSTFVAMGLNPSIRERIWTNRFSDWWRVVGRLAPGATVVQAQAEMTAIGTRLAATYPTTLGFAGFGVNVVPMHIQVTGRNLQLALWVLMGAGGFVLLIACANVANLMLARGAGRERELALRAALGARRWRLVRQLAVESAVLVVGGTLVGLLLSNLGVAVVQAAAPPGIPRLDEIGVDGRVLMFGAGSSVLAGLLFGIMPASKTSLGDPANVLKQGGRSAGGSMALSCTLRTFVIVECALAMALLAGAGLLIKSFIQLQTVNPGFSADNVLLIRVTTPMLSEESIERLSRLPGVQAAGAIEHFDPRNPDQPITAEGRPPIKAPLTSERVTAGFFQTIRVPLIGGRFFGAGDNPANVAIINHTMSRTFWPDEDPIGKRFKRGDSKSTSRLMTIVGVVGDMRRRGLEHDAVAEFYVPEIPPTMDLAIRTASEPLARVASVRDTIRSIDRRAVIGRVTTVESRLGELGAARKFQTWLITCFAALALLLCATGIYGVMRYAIERRTHEMGIRIALGARAPEVLALVVGEGLRLVAIGIGAGLLIAFALGRVMAHLLFQVSATDPATLSIAPTVLTIVALLACYLPARRASRVDPVVALRTD